ncbi:MAG TPA: MFS transporter [Candidatus Limnocylindria bacterium]
MTPERRALVLTLGFLSFAAVYNGLVMNPVLEQIAREFGTSTGTAGLVVAAYGAPGVAVAMLAGPYSDRIGRKPFLVIGPLIMGIATLAAAIAPSFALIVAARIASGVGAAVIFPNINATIGDTFPYRERGSVLSTTISMNTLASIVGVPIAGIIAELLSWRVSLAIVGTLAIAAGIVLLFRLDRTPGQGDGTKIRVLYGRILHERSAVAAIVSSFLGALFWFTWVTYLVVFFQRTFGLSEGIASTVALTMGLGVLVGSQLGGRMGDRIGHRRIVAGSVVAAGALLLIQTSLALPLAVTALLNLVLSAVIGARFATNQALMSEQVPGARGTMLALSSAVASLAVVVGATVGGLLVDGPGFAPLGLFCFGAAVLSAAIVLRYVVEEPIDLEVAPLV